MSLDQHVGGVSPHPHIPDHILVKWQGIVDTVAELLAVPTVVVSRVTGADLQVVVTCNSAGNFFHSGAVDALNARFYDEFVIKERRALHVHDSRREEPWNTHAACRLGIVSYLGFPILWPDGTAFGTLSIFDTEARAYSAVQTRLVEHLRDSMELHLVVIHREGTLARESATPGDEDALQREITARRIAEEDLRSSEARWQEAAEALNRAKETAEAAERAKGEFLATMSHEIRTPMNTVTGMARLALLTDLTPKQRNYLNKIDASAKSLLGIVSDILDFSKIEAGHLELVDIDFSLESILESVSAVTAMRAEEKGLEIVYAIASSVPRRLRGDPHRLSQILINLVGNAVKFTHEGEIVVSVGTVPGSSPLMLRFAVQDTGIGLTADEIANLFQPFTQAHPQASRNYGGTGLGLTISKHLIESMGGTIEVESDLELGSIFHFTVAAGRANAREALGAPVKRQLRSSRVLIVDDNASSRRILTEMASGLGMKAEAVDSGQKALTALKVASRQGEPFDLVLMDWRMPEMDGLETSRRIRADESLAWMPAVLMVTAYGREEIVVEIERLGLQGLLIKPVTESVMFNVILKILSHRDPGHSPSETQWSRPAQLEMAPPKTLELLAGKSVLVVDDNELNREVACEFLVAAGMKVDTAVNGRDALERIERHHYDAVLMDTRMPEMDGLIATREIRGNARHAALPIIALTAQARVQDRSASIDAGVTAYLTKPINDKMLYETLAHVISASAQPGADLTGGAGKAEVTEANSIEEDFTSYSGSAFDPEAALWRLGNNPDRVQRLIRGFLRDVEDAPARMETLLLAGDAPGIAMLAHTLKGSASYFDANEFCACAQRLEQAARRPDIDRMNHYGREFVRCLELVLVQMREMVVEATPAEENDFQKALGLIELASPLVSRGDYAAQALLDEIGLVLRGTPSGALAEVARMNYEDLELERATYALQRLKKQLELRLLEL